MKVYVVGGSDYYVRWIKDVELVSNIQDADIIFFTGGEDVTPSFYGCKKHPTTYNDRIRDEYEKEIFDSIRPNQLAVGVCRGSQFCCVMNGGKLVQNCNHHAIYGTHEIVNNKGEKYFITSTHHQMAYPFDMDFNDYDILYWAEHLASVYEGDGIDPNKITKEPEIILYHKKNMPKCIGIQGHPEMLPIGRLHDMLNKLILSCIR